MKLRDALNIDKPSSKVEITEGLREKLLKWITGMDKDDMADMLGMPPDAEKDFKAIKSDFEKLKKKYPKYFGKK